ncbi:MAG: hypothetical protein PHH59_11135 [Methylovulum sp.]|uniref:hypothetical protein n=1 Tax=Methylovulum sp. TaxID=1916980 RepID=UPI0026195C1C|nr:hypothetical protein [Methylovulum sp.]MDD2724560.1 hypothetical protein [Methylovulum sp.]MDD5123947.1 hypothetical protein [Methylovulum sp.]
MKPYVFAISLMLFQFTGFAHAGILVNGSWTPRSCGIKPPPPTIDDSTVDTFNKSVAAINTWQQFVKTYYECLIKEANTDNGIIADTANREQVEYRQVIEKIGFTADVAKKKLDNR